MNLHERREVGGRLMRHVDRAALQPLQMTLAGIERYADGVIEMRVRDEDMSHADHRIRTTADVESDAELAHAEPRLVTRTRTTFDREVRRLQRERLATHRSLSQLRRS